MNKDYKPLIVAVFLVASGLVVSVLFIPKNRSFNGGILEGISIVSRAQGAQSPNIIDNLSAYASQDSLVGGEEYGGAPGATVFSAEGAAFDSSRGQVRDPGGVVANGTTQSGIMSYTVRSGDTLPSIASYFGISVDTITAANPKISESSLTPGKVLKILPVSGVLYTTRAGDTLNSIASSFNISEDQIILANPTLNITGSDLAFINSGLTMIIPGGAGAATSH